MKKYKDFLKEDNNIENIDPYGEERWDDGSKIHDYYDMITLIGGFIRNLQMFEFSEEDIITFKIDYPHRGILDFTISENMDGEVSLCCDNLIGRFAIDSIVLDSLDPKDFIDKLTDLVENNIKPH